MRQRTVPTRVVWTTLLLCLVASPVAARQAACEAIPAEDPGTSPLLPRDHWAVRALGRAHALGVAPGFLPAQRAVPRSEVARQLRDAAVRAREARPEVAALASGWCAAFLDEFPDVQVPAGERPWEAWFDGSAFEVGFARHTGAASPGTRATSWNAVPRPDDAGAAVTFVLRATPVRGLGVYAAQAVDESGYSVAEWAVAVPAGPFSIVAGRQPVAYGSAESGAITLASPVPLTGVQVFTREPFRFPGFLRGIGEWSAHTFLSRLREPRHPGDPWLWGANLVWRPHARLTLSGNRVAIFGGDSVPVPMTPRAILEMLWGDTKGDNAPARPTNAFENQSASVEVAFRPPTESVLPLVLYVEAGMEDIDVVRGLRDSPGFVAGVTVPSVPGLPMVQLGFERTIFGYTAPETRNGVWYQHFAHTGGWALDEGPLGHPLGGHGTESLAYVRADLLDARLRVLGHGFWRHRGPQNLYAPARGGRSRGFLLEAHWRFRPRAELRFSQYRESGDGWRENRFEAGLSVRY